MSGTKPTPGPWVVSGNNNGAWEICAGAVVIAARNKWNHRAQESLANARLIVRAVNCHDDLLAALKAVLSDIAAYERINNLAPNPGRQDCWDSVTAARAALAKALEP